MGAGGAPRRYLRSSGGVCLRGRAPNPLLLNEFGWLLVTRSSELPLPKEGRRRVWALAGATGC